MKVTKSEKRMRANLDHTTEQAVSGSMQALELHDDMELDETNEDSQTLLSSETDISSGSIPQTSHLRKRSSHQPTAAEEEILNDSKNIKTQLYYPQRLSTS